MWASYSALKFFSVVSAGVAAASPNAHKRLSRYQSGDILEQREIFHLPFAALDLLQNIEHPLRAFAARRTFAAGLVPVEPEQVFREPHHTRRVVEHDDAGRAEQRTRLRDAVEARFDIQLIGKEDWHRRASRDDRFQRATVPNASRVVEDQLPQRDLHRGFVHSGFLDVAADAIQLRPAVLLGTECGEPLCAVPHD